MPKKNDQSGNKTHVARLALESTALAHNVLGDELGPKAAALVIDTMEKHPKLAERVARRLYANKDNGGQAER